MTRGPAPPRPLPMHLPSWCSLCSSLQYRFENPRIVEVRNALDDRSLELHGLQVFHYAAQVPVVVQRPVRADALDVRSEAHMVRADLVHEARDLPGIGLRVAGA